MKSSKYDRLNRFDYLDLFNLYAQTPARKRSKISGFAKDAQSLASDWRVVGNTLRDVITNEIGNKNFKTEE